MAKANKISKKARAHILWPIFFLALPLKEGLAVEINWYGAGCLTLTDNESIVLIDPFVSRPSWWKVLTNQGLHTQKELVEKYFGKFKNKKHQGIFITHNHFDHILDLPASLEILRGAKAYVPNQTTEVLKLHKVSKDRYQKMTVEAAPITVGNFKIQAFDITHSSLPLGIRFAHGSMDKEASLPLGAFDIKAKSSFSYYIQHPDGDILYHPSAEPRNYDISEVDTLIVGLTSRSLGPLKKDVINKIKHQQLIAVHNDNFFYPLNETLTKMPFYPTLTGKLSGHLPKSYQVLSKKENKESGANWQEKQK